MGKLCVSNAEGDSLGLDVYHLQKAHISSFIQAERKVEFMHLWSEHLLLIQWDFYHFSFNYRQHFP